MHDDGELTLEVGQPGNVRTVSGWTEISVTRGLETCPNSFEIALTEVYPGQPTQVTMKEGDPCRVHIGGDLVMTGYIDVFNPQLTANGHEIRVTGRGKCQDLVDCSAEWPNGQISGASVLAIAQKLAAPYGITVAAAPGVDVGGVIPQFNLCLGETAYEIIERICRYRGLLAYEQPDGSLLLDRVGTVMAASGFVEDVNAETSGIAWTQDQRYSEIWVVRQNTDVMHDAGDAGNLIAKVTDPGVLRNRKLIIIAETVAQGMGNDVATLRGIWERNRRLGRSSILDLKADSWRDLAGTLWAPNMLVPVSFPTLKLDQATWCIGSVTYTRGEEGTHASVTIMPPSAFSIEPLVTLQAGFADVNAGAPSTAP